MVEDTERLEHTLGFLSGRLNWGWLFLQTAKALHNTSWRASAIWFHRVAYEACIRESIIVLDDLLSHTPKGQDSINLYYLFNQADHKSHLFQLANPDQVRAAVADHRRRIVDHRLKPTLETVRDKVVAHFDRKHINDPAAIARSPIDMSAVEDAYSEVLSILNVYLGYYDDSALHLTLGGDQVREDIEYIAQLIEEAGQRPPTV